MHVRPIIFSAPMVLALLAGRKTMTRRLLYAPRHPGTFGPTTVMNGRITYDPPHEIRDDGKFWSATGWQNVKPGDLLYVRENLTAIPTGTWRYAADETSVACPASTAERKAVMTWTIKEKRGIVPSIHMPRWASRITLRIEAVKIERLNLISAGDAVSEGIEWREGCWAIWNPDGSIRCGGSSDVFEAFRCLWTNIHGNGTWEANPWVVALALKVHQHNVDSVAMRALAEAA